MIGTPKPVTIRGVTYESHRDAAEALGVHFSAISKAKSRGYLDTVGLHNDRSIPVVVDDVHYPSISAAARALGLQHADIRMIAK